MAEENKNETDPSALPATKTAAPPAPAPPAPPAKPTLNNFSGGKHKPRRR